ncbi:hypothetical protein JW935_02015 [candidate division KSB1 bacterium]|nr:hypothetical protein [candidate division KSB1 bacterium]
MIITKNGLFLIITIGLIALMVMGLGSCSKKEQDSQLTADENVGTISPDEKEGSITVEESVQVDLAVLEAELVPKLLEIEKSIMTDPTNVELRRQFVEAATDEAVKKIRAVGIGKPPETGQESETVLKLVERAAIVDSYRWLAYLQKWSKDPSQPDFGSLSGDLPASHILFVKPTPEQGAIALVETDL